MVLVRKMNFISVMLYITTLILLQTYQVVIKFIIFFITSAKA